MGSERILCTSHLSNMKTHVNGLQKVRRVQFMFIRYGLTLAGAGVIVGVAAALVLTRLMSSLLFNVSALDPWTYAAVLLGPITYCARALRPSHPLVRLRASPASS